MLRIARRVGRSHDRLGNRFENGYLVDFLDTVTTEIRDRARPAQGNHRGAIDECRVLPGQQVQRAGTRRSSGHPGPARDPGVGVGGHRCGLLVAEVDSFYPEVFGIVDDFVVGTAHEEEEVLYPFFFERAG